MSEDRRCARRDAATSPIVGAVLTLTITIGAVAAVMAWGLPRLQASQAQATVDAVVEEMRLLDDLTDAIARSGGGVSGKAVVTYDRGGMVLSERGPIWTIAYGIDGRADVSLDAVADGDATYRIVNGGAENLSSVHVSHARIGDDRTTPIGTAQIGDLGAGRWTEVTVRDGSRDPVPLAGSAIRVRVHEFGVLPANRVAEAWIVDPGSLRYSLSTAEGHRAVELSNGDLLVESPTGAHVADPDAVRHVTDRAPRVFVSLERVTPEGPTTAGPGTWELDAVAGATRSLIPTGVEATDLSIEVPERADPWGQAIWNAHARETGDGLTSSVTRAPDGVRLEGPVDLHLFYRRIAFPSGLRPP